MIVAPEPRFPRLRQGVRMFDCEDGLIVRSAQGSFAVPPELRALAPDLLGSLDGRKDLKELLSGYSARDGLAVLALISSLTQLGLLTDGVSEAGPPDSAGEAGAARASGIEIHTQGLLSDAIRGYLDQGPEARRPASRTLSVAAFDRPDLNALQGLNRAFHEEGRPWLPVFPFGDVAIVGPVIRPGQTACFHCFELRWLGISPSIALESQYYSLLKNGDPECDVSDQDTAKRLAEKIGPLIVQAKDAETPAALWIVSTDSNEIRKARIEAHPLCDVCSAATRNASMRDDPQYSAAAWSETGTDLREVARAISPLVDSHVGLATLVPSLAGQRGAPATGLPAIALSRYAVPQPELIKGDQTNMAHASAADTETARTVALIEALERYCGVFPPRAHVVAPYAKLDGTAVLPTELPLFSDAQYAKPGFPYRPFNPDKVIGWTWAWNLTRNMRILVPSAAVCYGAEDDLVAETSNGVAAHSGRGSALINAALELIERDAFMIHWLHQITPPRYDHTRVSASDAAMIACIEASGYTVALLDVTTDLKIPVVLALGIHDSGTKPALMVGAGASLVTAEAMRRALGELYAAVTGIRDGWVLEPPIDPSDVVELRDHSRAYEHPSWLPHAAFLWSGQATRQIPEDERDETQSGRLRRLIEILARHGHDLIGVDISAPEVSRCGLRVVRAIVPGLQPLAFGPRIRLGGRRLYEAPMRMDATRPPATEESLNSYPHCFP